MCVRVTDRDNHSETYREKDGKTDVPTCVNISFVLLQSVLALKSFATAFCFTDKPGVSFTGLLMLLKTVHAGYGRRRRNRRREIYGLQSNTVFLMVQQCALGNKYHMSIVR